VSIPDNGTMLRHPLDLRSDEPPWFRTRPGLTLVVAGVLFAAIFALRLGIPGPEPAVSLLFVLPVALLALARGLRAGLASGVIATVLLAGWSWANDVDLSLLAWATRVVPLVLTGLLLGDASDRLARSEARRVALELASERHSRAAEINDSLVQGMASAKWSLETGDVEAGIRTLRETIGVGQRLVSQLMRESSR
jgi:glucose-6-phosphate-specific signal transduction histidine kinase